MNKQEEGKMRIRNKVGGGERKMKKWKREKKTDQEANSARFEILLAMTTMMMMIHVFWDGTPYRFLLWTFRMAVTSSSSVSKNEQYVTGLPNPEDEDSEIFETSVRIRQSTHCNIPEDLNLQISSPYMCCSWQRNPTEAVYLNKESHSTINFKFPPCIITICHFY